MITVPQNNNDKPGTWKGISSPKGLRKSASLICPNGHTCNLRNYEILENGSVHPSVLCPTDGCGFNEFITLEGWSTVAQPAEMERENVTARNDDA